MLLSVQTESPAAKAGLLLGDTLLQLDGQPLRSPADLLPFLEEGTVGRTLEARVLRAGEVRTLSLAVGARGERA
jgi:S1-C subfamily serine protease